MFIIYWVGSLLFWNNEGRENEFFMFHCYCFGTNKIYVQIQPLHKHILGFTRPLEWVGKVIDRERNWEKRGLRLRLESFDGWVSRVARWLLHSKLDGDYWIDKLIWKEVEVGFLLSATWNLVYHKVGDFESSSLALKLLWIHMALV